MTTQTRPTIARPSRRHRALRGFAGLGTGAVLLATAATAVASPAPVARVASAPVAAHPSLNARGATMDLSKDQALSGTTVTVMGDAPLDARAGTWVTLRSRAFAGGSVRTQVSAQGTYQIQVKLAGGLTPGFYPVAGSFAGQAFPGSARQSLRISTAQLNGTMTVIYGNAAGARPPRARR